MAYHGPWGVQEHMPFTGGTYMTRRLRAWVRGTRISPMHDLPVTEWFYDREFMTIRQIPEWYRSAHGYMSPNWRCGGTDSHLWNMISARLVHCRDDNFEGFVLKIKDKYPGLCSWAYSAYAVPGIELVHLDDVDAWLLSNFGIESDNNEPRNSHKDEDVVITKRIAAICRFMENPYWWRITRSRPVLGEGG